MTSVYVNGSFLAPEEATVPVMDRAYLFADGVYEVIPVYAGKPFHLDRHMARLSRSLAGVGIAEPMDSAAWLKIFDQLIDEHEQKTGSRDLNLYLQVTRGASTTRNHKVTPDLTPSVTAFILKAAPYTAPEDEPGMPAITVEDIRWGRCDIKSVALLPNVMATQQAQAADAEEAILVREGFVTEGAASNVFIVKDGIVKTSPSSQAILSGITREVAIELLKEAGICVQETPIAESELNTCDEIWRSNSTREVLPITHLNGTPVANGRPGPLWFKMRTLFDHYKTRYADL